MTAQEVYNALPNDFVELVVFGHDYAKKNKENKYSILFFKQMDMLTVHYNEQMDGETIVIEIKKTVARLISSVIIKENT